VADNRTLDSKTDQAIALSGSRRRQLRANLAALNRLLLKNFQLATTVQKMQITTTRESARHSPNQPLFGEGGVSVADEISQPLCAILCNLGAASNLFGAGSLELSEILADVRADTLRACEIVEDMRTCSAEKLPGTDSFSLTQLSRT